MSSKQDNDNNLPPSSNLTKDQQKKGASSVKAAHIKSILSKSKFIPNGDHFADEIKRCLKLLDTKDELLSLILKALKFSDHVTIIFDLEESNLERVAKCPDALGWYSDREKELIIGAKEMLLEKELFLGVFAHELAHWCMAIIFKNKGLPYYSSDPKQVRENEFDEIVREFHHEITVEGKKIHPIVDSVFTYDKNQWHKELIVRVPHLIAQYGSIEGFKIISCFKSTQRLLNFYQNFVLVEMKKFIENGDLEGSRRYVGELNKTLGLVQLYQEFNFKFNDDDLQLPERTSLLVFSSCHPYLSFMKIAWTLNCLQPNNGFYENNLFCDFDAFEVNYFTIFNTFCKLDECKTLVLVCSKVESKSYRNLLPWLNDMVSNPGKKVILIIANMLRRATERQLAATPNLTSICISMEKMELSNLLKSSWQSVLQLPVAILGEQAVLGDLLSENELDLVDGILLERLLRREEVVVGRKPDSVHDRPPGFAPFYESMSVVRAVGLISKQALTDDDYFVIIVGNSENYADEIRQALYEMFDITSLDELFISSAKEIDICESRHILLLPPGTELLYSEYSRLVGELVSNDYDVCYFINIESKESIYCDLMYLQAIAFDMILHLKYSEDEDSTIDAIGFTEVVDSGEHRVIVLSDEAGSGKSLFLNSIYHSIIDRYWVVKVSLKSCIPFIDRHPLKPDLNKESAINFLLALGRIEDKFAKDVFSRKMDRDSEFPIVLMLDGLDEMTASDQNDASINKEKIANLLMFLRKSTHVTTIVTTRPESEMYLNKLSSPIYKFKSLSEEARLTFIQNFCLSRVELFSESEAALEFVDNSQFLIRKRLGSILTNTDFFETPLNVTMFAEIYLESLRTRDLKSNLFITDGDLRLDMMYSEFIKLKYQIYFRKMRNAVDHRLKDNCDSAFRKLALFSLYGNEKFCKIFFSNDTMFVMDFHGNFSLNREVVARYFDIGIISSATSSAVTFVHTTFAEYFVSHYFISWSLEKPLYETVIQNVVYRPHETITRFYEHLLPSIIFSEDLIKTHGDFMVGLNIFETISVLSDHMKLGHLNIVDYILFCWRLVGKSQILFNPDICTDQQRTNRFSRVSQFVANIIAGHSLPTSFDYDFDSKAYYKSDQDQKDESTLNEEEDLSQCLRLFERGKVEFFKCLFEQTEIYSGGRNLIHLAAASGNVEVLTWLESIKFDIFSKTATGASTVTIAIRNGKLEMSKWLKDRSVCIEWHTCNGGLTTIHDAVIANQFPAIEWLVSEGLNINSRDSRGLTPLHLALKCYGFYSDLLEKIEYLCKLGADVNACSEGGMSTMHHAAGVLDQKVVEWLVAHGCRVDQKTDDERSPLHVAFLPDGILFSMKWFLDHTSNSPVTISNMELIRNSLMLEGDDYVDDLSLILNKCDVNMRDNNGLTAAHIALNTLPLVAKDTRDGQMLYDRLFLNFKRVVSIMEKSNFEVKAEVSLYAKDILRTNESFSGTLKPVIEWLDSEHNGQFEWVNILHF